MDLIHKILKARTKDDLEALGIEHLNVDVDKRKTKEDLRAELVELAEQEGWAQADEPQASKPAPQPESKPTGIANYPGKLGRNKRTGRLMPWTSAMAKFPHMEEI